METRIQKCSVGEDRIQYRHPHVFDVDAKGRYFGRVIACRLKRLRPCAEDQRKIEDGLNELLKHTPEFRTEVKGNILQSLKISTSIRSRAKRKGCSKRRQSLRSLRLLLNFGIACRRFAMRSCMPSLSSHRSF